MKEKLTTVFFLLYLTGIDCNVESIQLQQNGTDLQPEQISNQEKVSILKRILKAGNKEKCPLILLGEENSGLHHQLMAEGMSVLLLPSDFDGTVVNYICVVILVEGNRLQNSESILMSLDVRLYPHKVIVVGIGNDGEAEDFMFTESLKNTVHVFYMNLQETGRRVTIKRRCLYCNDGESAITNIARFQGEELVTENVNFFPDEFKNFMGHTFQISALAWYPFLEHADSNYEAKGGDRLYPADSLAKRILDAMSESMNFTYEIYQPADLQWGSTDGEVWSGIVGDVQNETADFGIVMSLLPERLPVIDYPSSYLGEALIPISRKASPLPAFLAPARPFTGTVWLVLLLISVCAGFVIFAFSYINSSYLGESTKKSLTVSLLESWRILLINPLPNLPESSTLQVVIGFQWIFCLMISLSYKSSLIAHLSVPGKSPTLDTLKQLVEADGWTLGYEETYGSGWQWLISNTSPTIKKASEMVELGSLQENMDKVLAGKHMFVSWEYYITVIVKTQYTNSRGYSPIHISKTKYYDYGGYTFGCRRGAPFRNKWDIVTKRLIETGHISFWLNDLLNVRKDPNAKMDESLAAKLKDESGLSDSTTVILSLDHLQAAFYLLFLGFGLSLVAFCLEMIAGKVRRNSEKDEMTP